MIGYLLFGKVKATITLQHAIKQTTKSTLSRMLTTLQILKDFGPISITLIAQTKRRQWHGSNMEMQNLSMLNMQ